MKKALRFAVRLYPAWWRRRYGAEFSALLEESRPGWGDVLDLLKGAISMQMKRTAMIASSALAGMLLAFTVGLAMPHRYISTVSFVSPDVIPARIVDEALRGTKHQITTSFHTEKPGTPYHHDVVLVTFFPRDRIASLQTLHNVLAALNKNSVRVIQIIGTGLVPIGPNLLWTSIGGLSAGLLLGLFLVAFQTRPYRSSSI